MDYNYKMFINYFIGEPTKLDKPVNYCLTKDGVKEIRENEIGIFTVTPDKIAGLKNNIKEGLKLKLPKIPLSILSIIIRFFKKVTQKFDVEAIAQIFWDRTKKKYFIDVPEQEVTKSSVKYSRNKEIEKNHLLVADIHSHNTMKSFFSNTDDVDEKETRIFGVIGSLKDELPDVEFRISCGGVTLPIHLYEIFDLQDEFPKEFYTKLKIKELKEIHQSNFLFDDIEINKLIKEERYLLENE